jgi:hypothetical protein
MKTVVLGLCLCAALQGRDWTKYPPIVEVDTTADVYAIGDAHSDYLRLAAVMRGAGLIDSTSRWLAGNAVLVTTGDMVDKGPRALEVLRLLMSVREQAQGKGGRVIILAGNHEAEFLANPAAPKGKEFADQLRAEHLDPADIGKCKGEIGEFLCSLSFGARVNKWFFSHGGNTGGETIEQLTAGLKKDIEREGYSAKRLVGENSMLEAKLDAGGPNGRPWIDAEGDERELLADYAKALGVEHIVEGHKPSEVTFADGVVRHAGEMFQRFGLFFLIDTGMSEGVDDSHGAALWISAGGTKATAVCPDATRTVLWDANTKPDTGRAVPCR